MVEVSRAGIRWRLDLTEVIDFAIFLTGKFEHSTVRAYCGIVKPGDVVLDIGANIGSHTLHLARCVGAGGHVIAFEPTAFAFRKLLDNLELNSDLRARITPLQVMLNDTLGTAPQKEIYSSWPLRATSDLHSGHGGAQVNSGRHRCDPRPQLGAPGDLAR